MNRATFRVKQGPPKSTPPRHQSHEASSISGPKEIRQGPPKVAPRPRLKPSNRGTARG
jgi:hypothetical protein